MAKRSRRAWKLSVSPQCSLCLCGESFLAFRYHRDTENTETALRKLKLPNHGALRSPWTINAGIQRQNWAPQIQPRRRHPTR